MLDVVFGQASNPGKVRTNNEDAMGSFIPASRQQARSHGFLFAVADGVGGLDLGEVASSTAVSVLTNEFGRAQSGAMLISLLPRLIQFANSAVHDQSMAPEFHGRKMATTLVACALRHDQAIVSHVGDSRCYLVRGGIARQITQDHTWLRDQQRKGFISAEEAAGSDQGNILTKALGPQLVVAPDTTALTLHPGDVLVLCSDGLHGGLSAPELAEIVSQNKSADELARELVLRAVELDGHDNTTAQVIKVRSVEQVGMYRGRPYRMTS
ncbi:MAG TPA: protein phosphatase 2C domain-containing protein [Terracidiphilus sp.]|jgi:protein phosphatase|nr:protein phosphatase 2C domain-containing protein [Terracidiphilus sp.]